MRRQPDSERSFIGRFSVFVVFGREGCYNYFIVQKSVWQGRISIRAPEILQESWEVRRHGKMVYCHEESGF